jgi:multidrug efflux pump subunit AcrA (membrane-fusion protein)
MPTMTRIVPALSALLFLAACGQESAHPPKTAEPPTVTGVLVGAAATAESLDTSEATGTVRSRTVTTVASQIMGRIVALHAREGSQVEAGQLLIELDDRDIVAQLRRAEAALAQAESGLAEVERAEAAAAAALAAAEAQRELAASTLARYQTLFERKAVAPQEYDQVAARHKAAVAEVSRAAAEGQVVHARRAQIQAAADTARAEIAGVQTLRRHTKIAAPLAGLVTAKHAEVGSMASPGAPLVTIEDSRRYWLEVVVPESQMAHIRFGQSLRIAVEGAGLSRNAQVSEILPVTDQATRTATVRVALPASPGLRSGLFGRAWIPVGRRQVLQVPRQAIVERGQLQGVYVVGQDGTARFRLVRTGPVREEHVEILSGLASGEQIVVQGADRVQDGARIARQ